MCLHHQRGTFGDRLNNGERRLWKDEERKGGIDAGDSSKEREMKKRERGGRETAEVLRAELQKWPSS